VGRDVERDIIKILAIGLFGVVVIKLVENSGGVANIVSAVGGVYTTTLGTLAKA
jgi:hypothetical protein